MKRSPMDLSFCKHTLANYVDLLSTLHSSIYKKDSTN